MHASLVRIAWFASALLVGASLGEAVQVAPAHARVVTDSGSTAVSEMQAPHDPKKKNAGDPCKSADECQAHHTCEKVGSQQVCKAPPPRKLPPGAVT
jgi:hypothetical protein